MGGKIEFDSKVIGVNKKAGKVISVNTDKKEYKAHEFIFAIGNAYLGLKTGTTVSASIPAAILSMAILRFFFKKSTILENNIIQTIATVGEGLAAGVVFTIPALIFLGVIPSISRIFILTIFLVSRPLFEARLFLG